MAKSGHEISTENVTGSDEVAGHKGKFDLATTAKIVGALAAISGSIVVFSSNVRSLVFGGGEKTVPATGNVVGSSTAVPMPPSPAPVRIATGGGTIELPSAGPIRVEQLPHGGSRTTICPAGYGMQGGDCIPPPPPPPPPPPYLPPAPPPPPPPLCPDCPPPPPPPPIPCVSGPFIVFFDWDRDEITPQAAAILDNAAAAYLQCGRARVVAAGHADRSGPADYNLSLSQRRADNARSHLAGRGIPGDLIATEAFGESRPLVETADGVREAQNRRVEVTFGPNVGW